MGAIPNRKCVSSPVEYFRFYCFEALIICPRDSGILFLSLINANSLSRSSFFAFFFRVHEFISRIESSREKGGGTLMVANFLSTVSRVFFCFFFYRRLHASPPREQSYDDRREGDPLGPLNPFSFSSPSFLLLYYCVQSSSLSLFLSRHTE